MSYRPKAPGEPSLSAWLGALLIFVVVPAIAMLAVIALFLWARIWIEIWGPIFIWLGIP